MNIEQIISEVFNKYKVELSGDVSATIPALSQVDPDSFAISVVGIDGKTFEIGDTETVFTIQSISKPFTYGLALEQHGNQFVETKVGMEPTGEDFDSIIKLDDHNRPFNPMVNSGAIVMSSLIDARTKKTKSEEALAFMGQFAGRDLTIDQKVYQSEAKSGHKNWAIAHLLRHFNILTRDFKEDLDVYFNQCSTSVNITDLAMMGATLANDGINPLTNSRCLSRENLRHVLSILFTCGMYNYSGEWVFDVGLPAKSGISGAVLMVVPGKMAIAVFSPRLDRRGNSVRGIKVCEELSENLGLHLLD